MVALMPRPPFEVSQIPLTLIPHFSIEVSELRIPISESDILALCCLTEQEADDNPPCIDDTVALLKGDSKTFTILSQLANRFPPSGIPGKLASTRGTEAGSSFGDIAIVDLGKRFNPSYVAGALLNNTVECFGVDPYHAGKAGKALGQLIQTTKATSITCTFKTTDISPVALKCFIENLCAWSTPDDRFKKKKIQNRAYPCLSITILLSPCCDSYLTAYKQIVEHCSKAVQGERLARELVNTPANICTTEALARKAQDIADSFRSFTCVIYNEEECKRRSMGAYLAVAQGSMYEPQFIHLTYTSEGPITTKLVFIGKGICMDTGGYNLKVGANIEQMKYDMAGAAAVLGAAQITGSVAPAGVEVHFIIPAAENMISARASRPGDIITASNGTTIEIGNTDAEGRLILADALCYACTEVKPDFIIDCATLTGACKVGLGASIGALYGTHTEWTKRVLNSAHATGTPLWPMPLFEDYASSLHSHLAEVNNMASTRYGGSITAALFLKRFVNESIPWCHLDMAGPAFSDEDKEASGYGSRLFAHIIQHVHTKAC